jgi:hypothetical protein
MILAQISTGTRDWAIEVRSEGECGVGFAELRSHLHHRCFCYTWLVITKMFLSPFSSVVERVTRNSRMESE